MAEKMRRTLFPFEINRPLLCAECESVMVYKGLGEYQCENCRKLEYDEYGKVRNYLEEHSGANVAKISSDTGVTHSSIREMIKESRFAVIENRGGYIRCEMCGDNINMGRLCQKCEATYHRKIEDETRSQKTKNISGYVKGTQGDKGSKRFTRER